MAPHPAPAWNSVPTSLVVLVVDDHHDAADSLALLLRLWGHDVRVAYDGSSAWRATCDQLPDVLLLDLGLPQIDGLRLARMVRQLPDLQGCILVAVTGYPDQAHQRQCQEAGFDYFLAKPADPKDLKQLLQLVAKGKKIRDQAAEGTLKGSDTVKLESGS